MNRRLVAFVVVGAGVMDDVQYIGDGEFVVTEGVPS